MDRTALDLPAMPTTAAKPREGLFANHWALYIGVVLLVALGSYAFWLKTRSIFACQAQGYSADRYLAYCGGGNYADFEHGAFYFNLEPPGAGLCPQSRRAGDRQQPPADRPVQRRDRRLVQERGGQLLPVGVQLQREHDVHPGAFAPDRTRARASSSSMSTIFSTEERPWRRGRSCTIPNARSRYEVEAFLAEACTSRVCGAFPRALRAEICHLPLARNGGLLPDSSRGAGLPAERGQLRPDGRSRQGQRTAPRARSIFSRNFAKGRCVILTHAPFPNTKMGNVEAIAAGVGLPLVAPELDGLNTSDGYHLDRASADRWARAFLRGGGARNSLLSRETARDAAPEIRPFHALHNRSGRLPWHKAPPPEVR